MTDDLLQRRGLDTSLPVTSCHHLAGARGLRDVNVGTARGFVVIATLLAAILVQPGSGSPVLANDSESPVTARNAIVVDAESGQVLFDKGGNEPVPPASLTKIFTTIVALETAALESEMNVDEYDLVGEASVGLSAGETVTMETLLHGLMLTSGNDAAMTLSRELGYLPGDTPQESVSRFVDRVNATAERLGLDDTELRNPHGLDQDGHVSSASDIAAMTMYALDNPVFKELISTPYYSGNGREFYNVNEFLDAYSGLIGGKTGVTTRAGYNLMQVAERDGKTVIAVLLGSTRESWYADAEYLLNLGFYELNENPDDGARPVIGVAGVTGLEIPELASGTSVGGNLTVDRVNDNEAIIRPNQPVAAEDSTTWRWLIISIGVMSAALVLFLSFPTLLGMGALAFSRGSRMRFSMPSLPSAPRLPSPRSMLSGSRQYHRRHTATGIGWQPEPPSDAAPAGSTPTHTRRSRRERDSRPVSNSWNNRQEDEPVNSGPYPQAVTVSPARSRAEHAIKLAMQGRYHVASEEFRLALERDPDLEISSCPGFWRMQPMGYIAVARAYSMHDRRDQARRLLTVVQLAHKQNEELSALFGRAIEELED